MKWFVIFELNKENRTVSRGRKNNVFAILRTFEDKNGKLLWTQLPGWNGDEKRGGECIVIHPRHSKFLHRQLDFFQKITFWFYGIASLNHFQFFFNDKNFKKMLLFVISNYSRLLESFEMHLNCKIDSLMFTKYFTLKFFFNNFSHVLENSKHLFQL